MKLIVVAAGSLLPTDMVCLRVLDEHNQLRTVASSGAKCSPMLPVGVGLSGLAAKHRSPVVTEDCRSDPRLDPAWRWFVLRAGTRPFVAMPIVEGTRLVGVLGVGTRRPTPYTSVQIERLGFFARQVGSALRQEPCDDYHHRLLALVDDLGTRLARVEALLAGHNTSDGALNELALSGGLGPRPLTDAVARAATRGNMPTPAPRSVDLLLCDRYRSGELPFVDAWLEPLLDEDERHGMELVYTLAAYLENSCNISKTARQLFVHRNTATYRLMRCQEIGHFNLEDGDTRFQLQVALRVARLAGRCNF